MALQGIVGTTSGSVSKHADVGSNTLPAGTHFMLMWDTTQLTTLSQLRIRLQEVYNMAASNKAFTP